MLGETNNEKQTEFYVTLDVLRQIPDDHILKRVDKVVKFGWIRDEVRHLYADRTGRPSIDPEAAIRLMLAGFFHGIVHDRKLMREAQVNIAYRWFAGYRFDERLPDHSTLSKLRKRWGVDLFRKIFVKTVRQCVDAGLVDAETVHVDATLIRADVSWESIAERHADDVVRENDDDEKGDGDGGREKKVSSTDPDASLTKGSNHDKPQPRYKQHTVVDDKSGVVVDVGVTTGRTPEASKLVEQVKRVEENTGAMPLKVTADASYATGENFGTLEERGIEAVIPTRKVARQGKCFPGSMFKYDAKHDHVKCPCGKKLVRGSRYKNGFYYRSKAADCMKCRLRDKCVPQSQRTRKVLIVGGYTSLVRARRKEARLPVGRRGEYVRHKWLVEGRHGEAKTQHGLSRAARRGLGQVAIQVYMTAIAMNLKRLATASITASVAAFRRIFAARSLPGLVRTFWAEFFSIFTFRAVCRLVRSN
jgi:transposase